MKRQNAFFYFRELFPQISAGEAKPKNPTVAENLTVAIAQIKANINTAIQYELNKFKNTYILQQTQTRKITKNTTNPTSKLHQRFVF